MKKNEEITCIYRNEDFENQTRADIQKAKEAIENMINIWMDLDVGGIVDVIELINDPEKAYSEAVHRTVEVPQLPGKFQIAKDVYIQTLSIPIPDQLYRACRDCRKHPYCFDTSLWGIKEGNFILNEEIANELIDSQSIYCDDPEKQEIITDYINLCELLNKFNTHLLGDFLRATPVTIEFCRGRFVIADAYIEHEYGKNYTYALTPDPEFLRSLAGA